MQSIVIKHWPTLMQLVPFKTMTVKTTDDQYSLNYFGALAFGCNVFLQCHTDSDFTMSIANVHLKGKDKYEFDDPIVIYFCFPTLGIAVPLRPGDFIMESNELYFLGIVLTTYYFLQYHQ